jgi:hypothetical protein
VRVCFSPSLSPSIRRSLHAACCFLSRIDKHVLPANVSDFHDATQKAGVYLATAGADRLDLLKPLVISDLRLSCVRPFSSASFSYRSSSIHPSSFVHPIRGNVCYVGSSSMEVFVKMEALGGEGGDSTVLLGKPHPRSRESDLP